MKKQTPSRQVTRRAALQATWRAGAAALLAPLAGAGCAGPLRSDPNRAYLELPPSGHFGHVTLGMYATRKMRPVCEDVIPAVTDMRWLSPGDSVFVKVACNSPNVHPAVTHPGAVEALVGFFRDRGAGRVLVGDQAGVEHVRRTATGRVGATRELMAKNGLLEAVARSGAQLFCFDDQGWEGYARAGLDFESHWQGKLWLPRVLRQVDHVIYLPRLGTHAVAGYTCGTKSAVGWLRDDSRCTLHQKGGSFFELLAEINWAPALRDKLRLVLTLGDSALLNIGPDFGGEHDFEGCVVLASTSLVDHDALASILLPWLDRRNLSFFDIYAPYPGHVNFWNRGLVKRIWGDVALAGYEPIVPFEYGRGIEHDACLSHLARLQRYRPKKIIVHRRGQSWLPGLAEHLRGAGGGIFAV